MSEKIDAHYSDGSELTPLDSEKHILAQIAANTEAAATPTLGGSLPAGTAAIGSVKATGLKGEAGAVVETGTTAITGGDFEAIQCLEDTVLASYTSSTLTGDTLVGVTLTSGTVIYARFSAFTLTSGKVIAYNRN